MWMWASRSNSRGEDGGSKVVHRLHEAELLLDRFSRENQRLTIEVDQLRSKRQYVDHDYRSEPSFAQAEQRAPVGRWSGLCV
jgi:hypothetical protein